jgi:ribosome maturation factor RimP
MITPPGEKRGLEKTQALIDEVVRAEGLELVEVELKGSPGRRVLRIFIDRPGGINHHHCARISDQVGPLLEVEEAIAGNYTLEVSSPGLTRRLRTPEEFQRFAGQLVKVSTTETVEGSRHFRGTLLGMEGNRVAVRLRDTTSIMIPLEVVSKAHLDFDF